MERAAWTDERLDDLAETVRTGFARTDQDIRELRAEMHTEFASIHREIRGESGSLRYEAGALRADFTALRAEVDALRLTIFRVVGAGFLGIIAAILARGA
ncbi:MAG TPA: hypothetical protein VLB79_10550 [Solirubrobacterales bacterium]|nr:hypothetical protein [Solirubrobacterales bacterium]